jgi:hypothetical protein
VFDACVRSVVWCGFGGCVFECCCDVMVVFIVWCFCSHVVTRDFMWWFRPIVCV